MVVQELREGWERQIKTSRSDDVSTNLTVVIISLVYTYVDETQIVHFKYVQYIVCYNIYYIYNILTYHITYVDCTSVKQFLK